MSYNVVNPSTGELTRIAGGTLYADAPVGAIVPYGGTTAPSGFFICNGTELNRADYPELFAVIGTAFGTPSANTKFKLPDLRGEFLRGAGTNSHSRQGNGGTVGQHQDATTVNGVASNDSGVLHIRYSSTGSGWGANRDSVTQQSNLQANFARSSVETLTDNQAMTYTTRPTNTSVNFIIKAKQSAVPVDMVDGVKSSLIKSASVTSITDTNGNAPLGVSKTYICLGYTPDSDAYDGVCYPYQPAGNSSWWLHVESYALSPAGNVTVKGTVYYIEL